MAWIPPPEPVTWAIKPLVLGSVTYTAITLRAPSAADILKATAIRGEVGMTVALRLIAAISAEEVPYEALLQLPGWQVEQMSNYFESFTGAPLPPPLQAALDAQLAAATAPPPAGVVDLSINPPAS